MLVKNISIYVKQIQQGMHIQAPHILQYFNARKKI